MRKRAVVIVSLVAVAVLAYAFRKELNDMAGCIAYYGQCTAKRVSGLSSEECLKRPDAVAYLQEGGVCLVKQD